MQVPRAAVSCDPDRAAGEDNLGPAGDSPTSNPPGTATRSRPGRTATTAWRRDDLSMGMNPHHQHRRSNWDYVYVAAAMVVALGVLAWAFLG